MYLRTRLQEENKTLKLENENLSVDKGNLENEIKNLREWNNKLLSSTPSGAIS